MTKALSTGAAAMPAMPFPELGTTLTFVHHELATQSTYSQIRKSETVETRTQTLGYQIPTDTATHDRVPQDGDGTPF